jgi:outer membrane protein assembly factor BamB
VVLQVTGRGGVPTTATAVVLNVTAVTPAAGGYLTAYPAGDARPTASNVSFARGVTTAGRVVVSLGTGGRVSLFNGSTGSTHLLGDLAGYVVGSAGPRVGSSGFVPMVPRRLLDTRVAGAVQPGRDSLLLDADGVAGLPTTGVTALALNVTVVGEHVPGYLTTYPDDRPRPSVSDVNFAAFETAANLVVVKPSETGDIALYSSTPYARVVVDVTGYFTGAFVVPTQQWRSTVGGVYGPPVTDGRNILVGLSSRPTGDVATVRALEPSTGTVRWERRVEGYRMYEGTVRAGVPGVSLMTTYTSTGLTALSAEGAVLWEAFGSSTSFGDIRPAAPFYVVPFSESTSEGSRGGVAVVRADDGTVVWRRYGNYLGSSGDLVYVAEPASSFRAYRVADGTVAFDAAPAIGVLPPLTPAGTRLLTVAEPYTGSFCSGSGQPEIGALSATTGAVLWRLGLPRYSCAPALYPPLVDGTSVYYATSAGLRRHDLASGVTIVARENEDAPIAADHLVVHGGVLYATVEGSPDGDDEGGVFAYDPVTLDRLGLLVRGSNATVLGGVLHVMDVDPATQVATLVRLG